MSETRFRFAKSDDTVGFERDPRASGASTIRCTVPGGLRL